MRGLILLRHFHYSKVRLSACPIAFTADRYGFKRSQKYSSINTEDIAKFEKIIPGGVVQDEEDLKTYNIDWMKKYRGQSKIALKPKTTEQISSILSYCNERNLAVVPQGGNTGLVGGGVPVFDEIIISTSLMNKIESFDPISGILVCQAGCILENLDNYLAEKGFMMPLDLGAKGSCQIGGNVATNAGGLRLLRYGSLHGTVLGLEVVLPNGQILNNLTTLRKDNTGYDLKQLFIGSEGTIGLISKVSILTAQRPESVNVCLLAFSSYDKLLTAFQKAKKSLSEILSAFEFFDRHSMELTMKYLGTRDPFPSSSHPFYVLIETSGSNKDHDDEKLMNFLSSVVEEKIAEDGCLAQDKSQIGQFWKMREGISEAVSKNGFTYKYDLSIPVPLFYKIVEEMKQRLGSDATAVVGYGHIGDGNLHLNITSSKYDSVIMKKIEPYVYEWTSQYRGSISAEHGLGLMKAPFLSYSKDDISIQYMKLIKNIFDPKNILNPYKYLL